MIFMTDSRFDRNIRFFGKEGQQKLAEAHVVIVGVGGLGTHVVQQLALLGVGSLTLIDDEEIDVTNRNRYIGVRHDDPIPGTRKVDIGERLTREIDPEIQVEKIPQSLRSEPAFEAVIRGGYVLGCLDNEGARLILNELCMAYSKPYFDLASDIPFADSYGGRICVAWEGQGCIYCYGEINTAEAQADLETPEARRNRDAIYGVSREALDEKGPSVVSINGVIASLAVTEFILGVTGIRAPKSFCSYYGHLGKVIVKSEEPTPDCYYCKGIKGKGREAGVQRYLKI
jgi:molybdopterin/thiamine biosynthesis adenylyltransferase